MVVGAYLVGGLLLILSQSTTSAWVLGALLGTVADVRLLLLIAVMLLFSSRANIIILSAITALVFTSYLHFSFQEYWASLGIQPSYRALLARVFFSSLFAMALGHALFGKEPHMESTK